MSLKDIIIGAFSKNFLESRILLSPITSLVGFLHAMCFTHFQLPCKGECFRTPPPSDERGGAANFSLWRPCHRADGSDFSPQLPPALGNQPLLKRTSALQSNVCGLDSDLLDDPGDNCVALAYGVL